MAGTNLVEFIGDDIRRMRRFFEAAEGNTDLMDRYLSDLFNPSKQQKFTAEQIFDKIASDDSILLRKMLRQLARKSNPNYLKIILSKIDNFEAFLEVREF